MMKKNLLFMAAMAFALTVFTGCSDDDDNDAWQQLPTTEITGDNASFKVNGQTSATGSVTVKATSATAAEVNLKNVIAGYADVTVPVQLTEKSDGSFDFSGSKELTTPPAMMSMTRANNPLYTLTVTGNISAAGKAVVEASMEMTESAKGGIAGSWKLLNYSKCDENGAAINTPLKLVATATDMTKPNFVMVSKLVSVFGSPVLYNMLNTVNFNEDGSITAKYNMAADAGLITDYMATAVPEYVEGNWYAVSYTWTDHASTVWSPETPKNIANWYVSGDQIFIAPSISAMVGEDGEDTEIDMTAIAELLAQYDIELSPEVLTSVMGWMSAGIPLKYEVNAEGMLTIYVDKAMADPFVQMLLPALVKVDEMVANMDPVEDKDTIEMLNMLKGILGISEFAELETAWNNTDSFQLGLNLVKAN